MIIRAADLFAGAGGSSTGFVQAATAAGLEPELIAVNHWRTAVDTHEINHPRALHRCATLEAIDPRDLVPSRHLNLLIASPECTHHSPAAGGRPKNDQSRASAWHILRWIELLRVDNVVIENVPAFQSWGPLDDDDKPVKSQKGETYRAFLAALQSYGYRVEARILCAADYGEATTRPRLFILARRGRGPIEWPEPTHARDVKDAPALFRRVKPWRAVREVLDLDLPTRSIFDTSKRALSINTLRRIEEGYKKCGGRPFLLQQQSGGAPRSIDEPMPTIATGGAIALVEPFTVPYNSNGGDLARPISQPLGTITTVDRFALIIPTGTDFRYRMLADHELAGAMGFPSGYVFTGKKKEIKKQIGNAVSVRTMRALCGPIVARYAEARERVA